MEKVIFIHIPKNGGMSIRHPTSPLRQLVIIANKKAHISKEYSDTVHRTMKARGEHHGFPHARWRDVSPALTHKHKAVAIVRNPWSRTVSRYTFLAKVLRNKSKYATNYYPKGKLPSFEQFLEERHEFGNIKYYWHRAIRGWYPQKDYVVDTGGNLRCDILRLEHFDDDVKTYFDFSGTLRIKNVSNGKRNQQWTNFSERRDYRDYYTSETADIIADWYAADIDFFGFTFDGPATKNIWNVQ